LIQAGADVNALDVDGRTPIFYLFFKQKGMINSLKSDPVNMVINLLQLSKVNINIADKN
jgi:hypothetical protein